jgi:predicted restriction endonuclease
LIAAGSDAAVDREISKRLAQKRDRVLAAKIKALYNFECMACGGALVIGLDPERRHAEAAHIKPLGSPSNGPDKPGNMLVLCPAHHIQFDRGILSLRSDRKSTMFVSRIDGDQLHQKIIALHSDHKLDPDCVQWHTTMFLNVGK